LGAPLAPADYWPRQVQRRRAAPMLCEYFTSISAGFPESEIGGIEVAPLLDCRS
jgi:hypothetical protein